MFLRRVLISNLGVASAFYKGTIFDFSNEKGVASNAATIASNGKGKTTMLAMVFSVFELRKPKFVQTMQNSGHKYIDYLTQTPGVVALELEDPLSPATDPKRVVVGWINTSQREESGSGRLFFSFPVGVGQTLDNLPFRGTSVAEDELVRTWDDVTKFRKAWTLPRAGVSGASFIENHKAWKEHLKDDLGIPVELIVHQTELCKTEGGLAELFKKITRNEHVLRTLTDMLGLDDKAKDAAGELRKATEKLASAPILQRDIETLSEIRDKVVLTNQRYTANSDAERVFLDASNELSEYGRFLSRQAFAADGKVTDQKASMAQLTSSVAALDVDYNHTMGRAEFFRIMVHKAKLRVEEEKQKVLAEEIASLSLRIAAGNAADALNQIDIADREIDVKRETVTQLEEGVRAQLEPVQAAGSRYSAVLGRELASVKESIVKTDAAIVTLKAKIKAAEVEDGLDQKTAAQLENDLKSIAGIVSSIANLMSRSLASGRNEDESIEKAFKRLKSALAKARDMAEATEQAKNDARDAHQAANHHVDRLAQEWSAAETEFLGSTADLEKRRAEYLAFEDDAVVKALFAGATTNPLDTRTPGVLAEMLAVKKNSIDRMQRTLDENRALLDAYSRGLSRRDDNLEKAIKVLADFGINAVSTVSYISDTVPDAARAKEIVESDIGRMFHGITVSTSDELARVRDISPKTLGLDAPVHVSLGSHDIAGHQHDFAVLSPVSKSAYNKAALADDRAFKEAEIEGATRDLQTSLVEQATLQALSDRLTALLNREHDYPLTEIEAAVHAAKLTLTETSEELERARGEVRATQIAIEETVQAHDLAKKAVDQMSSQVSTMTSLRESFITEQRKLDNFEAHPVVEKRLADLQANRAARRSDIDRWEDEIGLQSAPLATLRVEMVRFEQALAGIRYKLAIDEAQASELSVAAAAADYDAHVSAFADENRSVEEQKRQLHTLEVRRTEAQANFDGKCEDALAQFTDIGQKAFLELARGFAALTAEIRRQNVNQLSSQLNKANASDRQVAVEMGKLEQGAKPQIPASWKEDRFGFEDFLASMLIGHEGMAQNDAERMERDSRIDATEVLMRLNLAKANLHEFEAKLLRLEQWADDLNQEIRRNPIAAAVAIDTRHESLLTQVYAAPQTKAEMIAEINSRASVINEAEKRQKRLGDELRAAKLELLNVCVERSQGSLSSETAGTLEVYKRNASGEVWIVEDVAVIRMNSTIQGFQDSLDSMQGDRERSLRVLTQLLTESLAVFKRATTMKIPGSAGRFGNAQILKCSFPFAQVTEETKQVTAEHHLKEMIDKNKSEEGVTVTGSDLINGLLLRLAALEGKPDGFKFTILVPIIQNTTNDYHNLAEMKGSGGQILTSAFLLYVLTASIRNASGGRQVGGVFLLLDNPLGAASAKALVQTQVEIAKAMAIQLVIVTPSNDSDPLGCFDVINTLHLGNTESRKRVIISNRKEPFDVLTAHHVFHLKEAA